MINKILATLDNLSTDDLEVYRLVLFSLYVFATIGVLVGVFLERERFSETVKDRGWTILVVSLALETLFSGIVFACDSEISRQQKVKLEKERSARLAMLDQLKPRDITRK